MKVNKFFINNVKLGSMTSILFALLLCLIGWLINPDNISFNSITLREVIGLTIVYLVFLVFGAGFVTSLEGKL